MVDMIRAHVLAPAKSSVVISARTISNSDVIQELKKVAGRGVHVTVVLDEETRHRTPVEQLQESGVEVRAEVWPAGGFEVTIVVDESSLCIAQLPLDDSVEAKNSRAFLWLQQGHSEVPANAAVASTLPSRLPPTQDDARSVLLAAFEQTVDGSTLPVENAVRLWPSSKRTETRLREAIGQARTSVDVLAHRLDSDPIVSALLEAANRGVVVRVIRDDSAASEMDEAERLRDKSGVETLFVGERNLPLGNAVVIDRQVVFLLSSDIDSAAFRQPGAAFVKAEGRIARDVGLEFDRLRSVSFGRFVNQLDRLYR